MVDRKLILPAVLVTLGVMMLFGVIAFSYNYGLFGKPLGDVKYDENGNALKTVNIYGQARIEWANPLTTNTWPWVRGSNLAIGVIDWSETQPFTLQVAPLFMGTGEVKCRADLLNTAGTSISSAEKMLEPFGGVFQDKSVLFNFRLQGYQKQDYKIKVSCVDVTKQENWAQKGIDIFTV